MTGHFPFFSCWFLPFLHQTLFSMPGSFLSSPLCLQTFSAVQTQKHNSLDVTFLDYYSWTNVFWQHFITNKKMYWNFVKVVLILFVSSYIFFTSCIHHIYLQTNIICTKTIRQCHFNCLWYVLRDCCFTNHDIIQKESFKSLFYYFSKYLTVHIGIDGYLSSQLSNVWSFITFAKSSRSLSHNVHTISVYVIDKDRNVSRPTLNYMYLFHNI